MYWSFQLVDPLKVDPLIEEKVSTETPEDVAVLYNWANLQGAQYRDFSASRREYRAQMHRRAAEQRRKETADRAVQTQAEAEMAQRDADLREAALREAAQREAAQLDATRQAVEIQRMRAEQARAAAIAAEAAVLESNNYVKQPSRVYEEVRPTAPPAAEPYIPAARVAPQTPPIDTRESSGPNEAFKLPAYATLPSFSGPSFSQNDVSAQPLPKQYREPVVPASPKAEPLPQFSAASSPLPTFEMNQAPVRHETSPVRTDSGRVKTQPIITPAPQTTYAETQRTYIPVQTTAVPVAPQILPKVELPSAPPIVNAKPDSASYPAYQAYAPDRYTPENTTSVPAASSAPGVPAGQPEWLYTGSVPVANPQTAPRRATGSSPISDTLQYSREKVASRWFALKGIFEAPSAEPEAPPVRQTQTQTPVLALFSLAGGVGKTSMVATLGRTLSALGEKTLLLDTTAYGLLPFYFGARELRPNTMRTFAPPSGSTDAAIHMISMNVESRAPQDPAAPDALIEDIQRNARGTNRIVMDVTTAAAPLARRIMKMSPIVLVPVAPDMNSVISLNAVEQFFKNMTDGEGRPVKVFYLLNQFDPAQPLHLDVREVLRQQLGDRLLPFVIRRSPAVSEALAEGMTVMDYAPNSPAAEDYLNLANWLRNVSAPVTAGFRGVRWSEQP